MDIKSQEERSLNMAKIRSKKTKPEMYIRSLLHRNGLRFRANYSVVAGKPDLFFSKKKIAVFVHGCYWHRHQGCQYAYSPKSNVDFWVKKLEGNRIHDEIVYKKLKEMGIRILIIWECTIKRMQKDPNVETDILKAIDSFMNETDICFLEL